MDPTIRIDMLLSSDLALRDNANYLFEKIESIREPEIVIDFSRVRSISRSFADQYVNRKRSSKKVVTEVNVPVNIAKMFDVVSRASDKPKLWDSASMQIITI